MAVTQRGLEYFQAKMRAEKLFEGQWSNRYNLRPTQVSPVIVSDDGYKIKLMRFGLIPSWAKSEKMEFSTINAKAETVDKLPTYSRPFKNSRCLIIVDGFYEFAKVPDEGSVPYYFTMKSNDPFLLAGVYDENIDAGPKPITSYSIITTRANDIVGKVHPRMPVVISLDEADKWLDAGEHDPARLKKFLNPFPANDMESIRVSKDVNFFRNEGAGLIKPVT